MASSWASATASRPHQAGLVPFGEIRDTDAACPTLTYNVIGRHQSRIVRTRVASNRSPWLTKVQVGDIVSVPISHGEGRFLCPPDLLAQLAENGQIATQYVDLDGHPTMDIDGNPNGSVWSVEASPHPTAGSSARWGTPSGWGPACTEISRGITILACSMPQRTIFLSNG